MQLRKPAHPGRVAIIAGGALLAVNLAIFGVLVTETDSGAEDRPADIERLFPLENAQNQPGQAVIGVDLKDTLQGVLYVDGARIPEDQYVGDRALGQVIFRPGEDQDFVELPSGPHRITVEFWSRTKTEEAAREAVELSSYAWTINVA